MSEQVTIVPASADVAREGDQPFFIRIDPRGGPYVEVQPDGGILIDGVVDQVWVAATA